MAIKRDVTKGYDSIITLKTGLENPEIINKYPKRIIEILKTAYLNLVAENIKNIKLRKIMLELPDDESRKEALTAHKENIKNIIDAIKKDASREENNVEYGSLSSGLNAREDIRAIRKVLPKLSKEELRLQDIDNVLEKRYGKVYENLSDKVKSVFIYMYIMGLNKDKIKEITGITPNNIGYHYKNTIYNNLGEETINEMINLFQGIDVKLVEAAKEYKIKDLNDINELVGDSDEEEIKNVLGEDFLLRKDLEEALLQIKAEQGYEEYIEDLPEKTSLPENKKGEKLRSKLKLMNDSLESPIVPPRRKDSIKELRKDVYAEIKENNKEYKREQEDIRKIFEDYENGEFDENVSQMEHTFTKQSDGEWVHTINELEE